MPTPKLVILLTAFTAFETGWKLISVCYNYVHFSHQPLFLSLKREVFLILLSNNSHTMHRFIYFIRTNQSFNDKFNKKRIEYLVHYETLCACLKPTADIEKSNLTCLSTRPKQLNISWLDFVTYFLQHLQHITLICKKYKKFIKELVEFINDLSITFSNLFAQVFDRSLWSGICNWFPLCFLSKLYHETGCYLFNECKHKKRLRDHLGVITMLKVPRETSLGCFPKNTLTHS